MVTLDCAHSFENNSVTAYCNIRNQIITEIITEMDIFTVPHLGLANVPIVETKFLELAMSLLDFSPRIPLGTFSILLTDATPLKFTLRLDYNYSSVHFKLFEINNLSVTFQFL